MDSVRTIGESEDGSRIKVGTRPLGFMLRYEGDFWSLAGKEITLVSNPMDVLWARKVNTQ